MDLFLPQDSKLTKEEAGFVDFDHPVFNNISSHILVLTSFSDDELGFSGHYVSLNDLDIAKASPNLLK